MKTFYTVRVVALISILLASTQTQAACDAGAVNGWADDEGGCRDRTNGVVWSRSGFEATGFVNWDFEGSATSYCQSLLEGVCPNTATGLCDDWRSPSKEEYLDSYKHGLSSALMTPSEDMLVRWAGPLHSKGKDNYAYQFYLSGPNAGKVYERITYNRMNGLTSYADVICVRSGTAEGSPTSTHPSRGK